MPKEPTIRQPLAAGYAAMAADEAREAEAVGRSGGLLSDVSDEPPVDRLMAPRRGAASARVRVVGIEAGTKSRYTDHDMGLGICHGPRRSRFFG